MTLKCHAIFEEKLTCDLEKDMRNLANFLQTFSLESVTIGNLIGSFCPKQEIDELKNYRGVMCNNIIHTKTENEQQRAVTIR